MHSCLWTSFQANYTFLIPSSQELSKNGTNFPKTLPQHPHWRPSKPRSWQVRGHQFPFFPTYYYILFIFYIIILINFPLLPTPGSTPSLLLFYCAFLLLSIEPSSLLLALVTPIPTCKYTQWNIEYPRHVGCFD